MKIMNEMHSNIYLTYSKMNERSSDASKQQTIYTTPRSTQVQNDYRIKRPITEIDFCKHLQRLILSFAREISCAPFSVSVGEVLASYCPPNHNIPYLTRINIQRISSVAMGNQLSLKH